MAAAYNGYLASLRVELVDGTWNISEDGLHVEVAGVGQSFECSKPIVDPLCLAYQLPAALRLFHQAKVLWAEALVLFKCMSEDENADVRWMLSHAIHRYPDLFESDCAPVLCDTFERLLRDDDLDVAEGIHKHYMDFVSGMATMDDERGRHLAAMFLDQGLWERRLHFAVFQSEQLLRYVQCGLVDNAREEAGYAIKLLLRHSCTTVRKTAAKSVVQLLPRPDAGQGDDDPLPFSKADLVLLEAVVIMSYGTCRERQTFVWACETALDEYPQLMNKYFKGPLETLVVPKKRGGASRSLAHDKAVDILYRLEHGGEEFQGEQVDLSVRARGSGGSSPSRVPASRLPQRGAGVENDPDFQVAT
jgi:hypothetical protein